MSRSPQIELTGYLSEDRACSHHLCKDVFNRVRSHKDAHALWSDICALYEGTKSEHEERYHLVMKKLNSFEMLT